MAELLVFWQADCEHRLPVVAGASKGQNQYLLDHSRGHDEDDVKHDPGFIPSTRRRSLEHLKDIMQTPFQRLALTFESIWRHYVAVEQVVTNCDWELEAGLPCLLRDIQQDAILNGLGAAVRVDDLEIIHKNSPG